ncbi:hypothetical protein [Arvimicrobium flavum]|uniref:hypothetical protein n=1 Tax=Arvimicrobium flavum TaxID=3393320 RepID=UPI00237B5D47|nr:hypothetical protein [Mesorhizobium shangrilense]
MLGLPGFHEIAARRGDGLRPELLELLAAREARAGMMNGNVSELGDYRGAGHVQAGPNPVGKVDEAASGNVVRFPLAREPGRTRTAGGR